MDTIMEMINASSTLLLDIEGVITSIEFVKEVLFPYAEKNAEKWLDDTWDSKETKEIVNNLLIEYFKKYPKEEEKINSSTKASKLSTVVKYIKLLIKDDIKLPHLKKLQGRIWRKAYETGDITGHVYEDVKPFLEKWKSQNLPIYIYSSGSIEAQKLLFKYSDDGDFRNYFTGHFDTTIGSKVDSSSYVKIAKAIGVAPETIVFITDLPQEAEQASKAKMKVIVSKRQGTVLYGQDVKEFPSISSFQELLDVDKANGRPGEEAHTEDITKQKL